MALTGAQVRAAARVSRPLTGKTGLMLTIPGHSDLAGRVDGHTSPVGMQRRRPVNGGDARGGAASLHLPGIPSTLLAGPLLIGNVHHRVSYHF